MPSWSYRTPVGTFRIVATRDGKFQLSIDGEPLTPYPSAETAARMVANHLTGHDAWDDLEDMEDPHDLSEWTYMP